MMMKHESSFVAFGRSDFRILNSKLAVLAEVSGDLLESLQANSRIVNILEIGV
jgi:hypothetical protein